MHAIYNPVSTYTPLEREAADARRERQRRIAARAVADTPIVLRAPRVVEVVPVAELPQESWEERQRRIPIPRKPWFKVLDNGTPLKRERPSLEAIFRAVLAHFSSVTMVDLLSARRDRTVLIPRHIVIYIARKMTLRSLPEIARRCGGRDHTTAISAIRKIEELRKTNEKIDADVRAVMTALGGCCE